MSEAHDIQRHSWLGIPYLLGRDGSYWKYKLEGSGETWSLPYQTRQDAKRALYTELVERRLLP